MAEVTHTVVRKQFLRKGGTTPEYVDEAYPTSSIPLTFGPGRGTATKGVGSAWLMGSTTLTGSPREFMYLMTKLRLTSSTPNVWFAFTQSRLPGTRDIMYLPSKGDDLVVGDFGAPLMNVRPGTVRLYALGPGSTISRGKGSPVRFQGIGSGGNFAIGASMDLYPV